MKSAFRYVVHDVDRGKWIVKGEGGKVIAEVETQEAAEQFLKAMGGDPNRALASGNVEIRSVVAEVRMTEQNGKPVIRGYGLVYNKPSQIMTAPNGERFREIIRPGAASRALAEADLTVDMHHNREKILGRRSAGTARFGDDEMGLWYEADLPDTSYARNLKVSCDRGDITGSSFVFSLFQDDRWIEPDASGVWTRELTGIHIYNMGPVTDPAYLDTTAACRSLEKRCAQTKRPPSVPVPNAAALAALTYFDHADLF